jgi:hypothetical protein
MFRHEFDLVCGLMTGLYGTRCYIVKAKDVKRGSHSQLQNKGRNNSKRSIA